MGQAVTNRNFEAAIIDSALDRRSTLRGALRVAYPHTGCHSFVGPEHVSSRANNRASAWDIVFVTARAGSSFLQTLESCKRSRLGANAVYVAVVRGRTKVATVANRIAEGFSAVLAEPYSADAVAEVTKLALNLENKQRELNEQRVVRLLVREICDQLDAVAKLRAQGRAAKVSMYLLSEMCEILPTLSPEMQSIYFEELCEITSRGKPVRRRAENDAAATALNKPPVPLKRMAGAI